jgi:DNA-binding GntR family transcriptional regulator
MISTVASITQTRSQLRDEGVAYIRELIVSGQVARGTLLRLGPLAETLGMSLTPVREALLLLAQSGWVTQEPNRGFRVARFERRDIEDTYFVNRILAAELTARAATALGSEVIAELRDLDASIQDAVGARASEMTHRWNYELHQLIYQHGRSPRLMSIVEISAAYVPRSFWTQIPGWVEHNRTGHTPIIDALEARKAAAARKLMDAHIAEACELLVAYLSATGLFDD